MRWHQIAMSCTHVRRRWRAELKSDRHCAAHAINIFGPAEPGLNEAHQPKNRTLKRGDGKGPVWSQSGRGLSPRQAPRWSDPPPNSECARGPKTLNAAPSGARRQARRTERVISPAHLLGALRGIPAVVKVEETACGLRPGRSPPPPNHRSALTLLSAILGNLHADLLTVCLSIPICETFPPRKTVTSSST